MKIAIFGMGNIGGGVADVIINNKDALRAACGEEIEIAYILDLREFPDHPLGEKVVHSIDPIINDKEVTLVCETMGGSHPAYEYTMAALRSGKHVVSSNKEVVSNFGDEFTKVSAEMGVHYLFEASVCGGIPLIRPMTTSLSSEKIVSLDGIVNGTTNYILTRLSVGGITFDEALAEAQKLGYAEPNPTADVDSIDAQRKICILTALMTGMLHDPSQIRTESIRTITPEDVTSANACGGTVKLIAHSACIDSKNDVFAAPAFVPFTSPLSHIDDVYNGVLITASVSGELMFFGRGAGKYPTAGSIIADITSIAGGAQSRIAPFIKTSDEALLPYGDHVCAHFFSTTPECAAVIADMTGGKASEGGALTPAGRHADALKLADEIAEKYGVRCAVYRVI